MKVKTDENIPVEAVDLLCAAGHDAGRAQYGQANGEDAAGILTDKTGSQNPRGIGCHVYAS
jgi:hypothetical protein